jgi:hypothetical protein
MARRKKVRHSLSSKNSSIKPVRGKTPIQHLRNAREYPIMECLISEDWDDPRRLTQIIVAREQPDGQITFGVYLVDKGCLGLKQTYCNVRYSRREYSNEIVKQVASTQALERCSPELAHQIIYQAIEYAAQFGFQPDKDFRDSCRVLEPRGRLKEDAVLEFGVDGKPYFVAGPRDRVHAIIRKLDRTVGRDNYHFIIPMDFPGDLD